MGSTVASYRPTKVSIGRIRHTHRTLPQPSWLLLIVITATVAGLVWGLMQQRRPQIDSRQVIAINLAAGELAFKHERYTEPAEHSAAHYFNAVLTLDPSQPRALRGLQQISEHFAERAKMAILDLRFADAAVAIEQLRRLESDDRRLGLLEIELRRALDSHVAALAATAAGQTEAPTKAAKAAQSSADDQGKSILSKTTAKQGGSTRSAVAANSQPSAVSTPRNESRDVVARDARITADEDALPVAESVSVEPPDEFAQGVTPVPSSRLAASGADQLAVQARAHASDTSADDSTELTQFSSDRPLPTPAAQMAATIPPTTPIEVSARWLPTAVTLVEPHYPEAAQVRGIEGWVDLMLTVAPTGEVIDAEVRDREGSRSFERAALLAVRQWRYEPNAAGGSAPAIEIPVRVAFKLE